MRHIPHPHLHCTREDKDRTQAAEALDALRANKARGQSMMLSYDAAVAHADAVDRYVHKAAPCPGQGEPYRWDDPGGAPRHQLCRRSDAWRPPPRAAWCSTRGGAGCRQPEPCARFGATRTSAGRGRAVRFGPGRRVCAPLAAALGRQPRLMTSTALAAAGLADLAVVAKQSRSIFNAQGTPAAPGTRLDALVRLSTLAAARSLAAAHWPTPVETTLALGPTQLGHQFCVGGGVPRGGCAPWRALRTPTAASGTRSTA